MRGRASNRVLPPAVRERVLEVASAPTYWDFGPTLLAEHLEARWGVLSVGEFGTVGRRSRTCGCTEALFAETDRRVVANDFTVRFRNQY